jgi:hypothetical protein
MELPAPEVILCDTSFVSHNALAARRPERYAHWPAATLDRISAATLAITPFTVGEVRAGYIVGKWGPARGVQLESLSQSIGSRASF